MRARKAAFLSSIGWRRTPAEKRLSVWIENEHPKAVDIALAKEIAFGTIKRWISLEYLLQDLLPKRYTEQEKLLFFQAGYQYLFMEKIPLYALVSQTVDIAKEKWGSKKGKLFNAILRKLPERTRSLKEKKEDLSIYYSYPAFFVDLLITTYGEQEGRKILETMNHFYLPSFRVRQEVDFPLEVLYKNHLTAATAEKSFWGSLISSEKVYIQNVTFVYLMDKLFSHMKQRPSTILDMCAAPGGKSLILEDLYPEATIIANDISQPKISLLQENKEKYHSKCLITSFPAEKYPSKERFDCILLDAPCSGSGVLGKRAEARYRLDKQIIKEQVALQKKMIRRAISLLSPNGSLWYMTCSILPEENEEMREFAKSIGAKEIVSFLQLPNEKGWDGGYASLLTI